MLGETTIKTEYQVFRRHSDGEFKNYRTEVFKSIKDAQELIDNLCRECPAIFKQENFMIAKRAVIHTVSEWFPLSPGEKDPPKKPTKKPEDINPSKKPTPKPHDMSIFHEYHDPKKPEA